MRWRSRMSAGEIVFDDVSFKYETGDEKLLSDVHRYGSMDNVTAVLSGTQPASAQMRKKRSRTARRAALRWKRSVSGRRRAAGGAGRAQRRGEDDPDLSHPAAV